MWKRHLSTIAGATSSVLALSNANRRSQPEIRCQDRTNVQAIRQLPNLDSLGLESQHMSIFTRHGERVSVAAVVNATRHADVVLMGETHDDPVAHQMELLVLAATNELKPCVLSMEMFESDIQGVVDEYMVGMIEEEDFLKDARPWANYSTDYRHMLEFAKRVGIPVIAANVPRRYVKTIGRVGSESFAHACWPSSSYAWIPSVLDALYTIPSNRYMEHIRDIALSAANHARLSQGCPYMKKGQTEELTSAVILWDLAMAHSIANALEAHAERTVLHVCGSFHCERDLGIIEMLSNYREKTKVVVIAIYPEQDCHTFDQSRHRNAADFVILTDAQLPRSCDHFQNAID